jgi:diguanylate cyclase (GGDEF)-like protein
MSNKKDLYGASRKGAISVNALGEPTSDLEIYSKEVLTALVHDNLPPTPSNFSMYFDRLMEDKSDSFKKQVNGILELEDSNDDEQSRELEKSLKQGFTSVKNILQLGANLYKNMALMIKILDKHKAELEHSQESHSVLRIVKSLDNDVGKLNTILKKQTTHMKTLYDETATIVKNVENETIFDNQYGLYNRRYFISKLEQEAQLMIEFKHKSSLITLKLSHEINEQVNNEKAIMLMTRTIARLLLKTSRRSDIIAHYGGGVFAMMLKHTNIDNTKNAAERLSDLVSSSNFFLAEQEINLKVAIGVSEISNKMNVDEIIICTIDAMNRCDESAKLHYVVCER